MCCGSIHCLAFNFRKQLLTPQDTEPKPQANLEFRQYRGSQPDLSDSPPTGVPSRQDLVWTSQGNSTLILHESHILGDLPKAANHLIGSAHTSLRVALYLQWFKEPLTLVIFVHFRHSLSSCLSRLNRAPSVLESVTFLYNSSYPQMPRATE